MYDKNSDYALNKRSRGAIVCKSGGFPEAARQAWFAPHTLPRSQAQLRQIAARSRRTDEADSGVARPQRFLYHGQHLLAPGLHGKAQLCRDTCHQPGLCAGGKAAARSMMSKRHEKALFRRKYRTKTALMAQRVGFEPTCSFLQTDFESFSSIGACWNLPECRGNYNR